MCNILSNQYICLPHDKYGMWLKENAPKYLQDLKWKQNLWRWLYDALIIHGVAHIVAKVIQECNDGYIFFFNHMLQIIVCYVILIFWNCYVRLSIAKFAWFF
jgi:hypothetical protein